MTLAAIFVSPKHLGHIFGNNHTGFTINLGGKYLYELSETKKGVGKIKSKTLNPSYIPGFWNMGIEMMSAIVGENGVGKTSIMNLFRLPYSYCWFVVEDGDDISIVKNTNAWDIIHYSAFFSQNMYGSEHENFYDYSKYPLMVRDTEYESLAIAPLMELHESENLKRWINFARLKVAKGLLAGIKLPAFDKIRARIHNISISEHQTSYAFRPFFKAIESKIQAERERREQEIIDKLGLTRQQVMDDRHIGNEVRMELHIVHSVMNKVRNIFESTGNKYLGEGELKVNFSLDSPLFKDEKDSRLAFYAFLDHAFIKLRKGNIISIPFRQVKDLIEKLISYIPSSSEIQNTDEMELSFDAALDLMDTYEDFLLAFKDDFAYDTKILMQFMPLRKMSSGERGLYELFSALFEANKRFMHGIHENGGDFNKRALVSDKILLLLDEGDLGFHPEWKKKYVEAIHQVSPVLFPGKSIQIIITTHDPLTLSDFPRENVVYLKREGELTINYHADDIRSFGANISTLLKNAFFVNDGLIGDFAKFKIESIIQKLNKWIELKNANKKTILPKAEMIEVKKIIGLIDEPIIQQKLLEMYGMISGEDEVSRQIREMEAELRRLKKQQGDMK